jgi:hypothetical protein
MDIITLSEDDEAVSSMSFESINQALVFFPFLVKLKWNPTVANGNLNPSYIAMVAGFEGPKELSSNSCVMIQLKTKQISWKKMRQNQMLLN